MGICSTYAMCAIPSSIFCVLVFPHEGKLVNVDQLTFTQKGRLETTKSTIPLIDDSRLENESLGSRMYTSLMGTFDMSAPINHLGSTSVGKNISTIVDRTDPWVLPLQEGLQVP